MFATTAAGIGVTKAVNAINDRNEMRDLRKKLMNYQRSPETELWDMDDLQRMRRSASYIDAASVPVVDALIVEGQRRLNNDKMRKVLDHVLRDPPDFRAMSWVILDEIYDDYIELREWTAQNAREHLEKVSAIIREIHAARNEGIARARQQSGGKSKAKPKPKQTAAVKPKQTAAVKPKQTAAVKPKQTVAVKPKQTAAVKPKQTTRAKSTKK
jgi:hypothetical protein